jgi:hypothetical protein
MKMMDETITGVAPTADNPEGSIGLDSEIESLQELKGLYKAYIKTL